MLKFHIGTSGVSVPIPQAEYPEAYKGKSRLAYYSSILNSLEVNSSFYRNPKPATVTKWSNEVPDDFSFTFKLSKTITHAKNLHFAEADLSSFLETIKHTNNKLSCILIQLPPSADVENSEALYRLLTSMRLVTKADIAVEFRHSSWYSINTYKLLKNFKTAVVMHDYRKGRFFENIDQHFYYYRFHGINSDYRGSYPEDILQHYAADILSQLQRNRTVYCYFNNTMGEAFNNACRIKELITQAAS